MVFELVEFEICQSHQASERQQLNPLLVLDLSRKQVFIITGNWKKNVHSQAREKRGITW